MVIKKSDLQQFLRGAEYDPHRLLGMHRSTAKGKAGIVVRAYLRDTVRCEVVGVGGGTEAVFPMECLDDTGFFEVLLPGARKEPFPYQLRAYDADGQFRQFFDPYSYPPFIGEQDLYLFNEGNEHRIYTKLGAHVREHEGVHGVSFAVWAPNAARVSVVGNFNHWEGRYHPMRILGSSGVWELFIPGLRDGDMYKFEILGEDGTVHLKTDPYGTYFESPPHNASIVYDTRRFEWGDAEWMERRAAGEATDRPISIYEVHLNSWRRVVEDGNRPPTYRELAPVLTDYVVRMGFTHVEVLPVAEHPFSGSWGYQVTGFFAPTHRFGEPADFMYLVDYLHRHGIGVILDWVPGHFPRDAFALARFDGSHLYEHADPRQGEHRDWGTLIFNYGRHEVRCFLISNALAWMDRYHIDGLRVDAVASMLYLDYSREEGGWLPNKYGGRENLEAIDFIRQANDLVHHYYPGTLMIAEESTSWPRVTRPTTEGGLGFDMKWNMGWMNDTLEYFSADPLFRKYRHNKLTFGMLYQYTETFVSVFSHDEVVHGKGSMLMKMGADSISEKARNLRALYGYMWAYPGKKLLFMGNEFGQSSEWHYDQSLDWHLCQYMDHEGIRRLVQDLNRLYSAESALSCRDFDSEGFRWINANDGDSGVISFLRYGGEEEALFAAVCHFTPVLRRPYRVGVPRAGYWREVINTDSHFYGGSDHGNHGGLRAETVPCDGFDFSLCLTVPPTATLIFKWAGE